MLQSILFTHNDMDGAGCVIVYKLTHHHLEHGKEYLVVNCSNGDVDQLVEEYTGKENVNDDTTIVFGDICASRMVLESLRDKFKHVYVYDHHATNEYATQVFPETATIIVKNTAGIAESGTSIMYKVFAQLMGSTDNRAKYYGPEFSSLFGELVDTIRSYDTYEWKETNNMKAKQLQTLFFMIGLDRFCDKFINRIMNKESSLIADTEMEFIEARLDNEQKLIDAVTIDQMKIINLKGKTAAVRFSGGGVGISELAYQFLTKHPEIDLMVGINPGIGTYMFRTVKDDIDLGMMYAQPIGGGGHAKAAAAPMPKEMVDDIMSAILGYIDPQINGGE